MCEKSKWKRTAVKNCRPIHKSCYKLIVVIFLETRAKAIEQKFLLSVFIYDDIWFYMSTFRCIIFSIHKISSTNCYNCLNYSLLTQLYLPIFIYWYVWRCARKSTMKTPVQVIHVHRQLYVNHRVVIWDIYVCVILMYLLDTIVTWWLLKLVSKWQQMQRMI